ncbi:aminopeptidase P family protein [[Clostridium] aminophilum]|uniref:aminopeptidase P family protein n=1 Tax=[Clostridium] aminophilum TaxID=1526 RepID=UPI0009440404|nr:aminopeptidase P family protein [[Clostridium] aminophilum]
MNTLVSERIRLLREKMREQNIDACLVPTSDPHDSEMVTEHYSCRKYITGFSGSAGTAVILREKAGLWTDGRYFVQAARELRGTGVDLFRSGEEGVPEIEEFLAASLPENGKLWFDGRLLSETAAENLENVLRDRGIRFDFAQDLFEDLWTDRPEPPKDPVWILDEKYAGKSAGEKLRDIRMAMCRVHADVHVVSSLDDIAWILNLRGGDLADTPVFLSYLMIRETGGTLYIDADKVNDTVRTYLSGIGIDVRPYDSVFRDLAEIRDSVILMEKKRVSMKLWRSVDGSCTKLSLMNPSSGMKAVKNGTEIENTREAHRKDAVSMIRFIMWLKENVGKQPIDEMGAAAYLDALRMKQEGCLGISFTTIAAYADNAAVVHYHPAPETNRELKPEGMILVDSGGQYLEGTTDITRTIALGPVTAEEKKYFTLVLAAHLRLENAVFHQGCRGVALDYAAREVLWKHGLDYNHGTGHGVAYLGPVHERPNNIRFRAVSNNLDSVNAVLEPGMITSDEPGLYIEGKCGIRTENLILCVNNVKNEFGQFYSFEPLTLVPIDLDAVDLNWLTDGDIDMLNAYHRRVREVMTARLLPEEQKWLEHATREVHR